MSGLSHAILEDYGAVLDETGRNYLERISRAGIKMGQLIDGLQRLARLSQREMRVGEVMLDALATEVVSALRESNPDRELEARATSCYSATGIHRIVSRKPANGLLLRHGSAAITVSTSLYSHAR